jgi:FkbM family methyltransferase
VSEKRIFNKINIENYRVQEVNMYKSIKEMLPFNVKRNIKRLLLREELELPGVLDGFNSKIETIFDIGANVGNVSLNFLQQFPNATVYSFEPSQKTFNLLQETLKGTNYTERSRKFKLGFYDKETEASLNITSFNGANSLIDITEEYHAMNPHIQKLDSEVIELMRLDDFVEREKIEHIDLVKIDVEGVEKQVLLGGKKTFSTKVDAVLMEISFIRHHRETGEYIELFKLMHELGFSPAKIYDVAHAEDEIKWKLAQFDCVFKKIK